VSTSPRTPWSPNRTNVDFRVTTSKDLLAWHVWIHNDKSRFDGPHMLFIFCFEGSYLMLMCDLDWGLLQSACVGANQQSAPFFPKKLRVQIWPGFFPHSSQPCLSDGFKAFQTSLLGCIRMPRHGHRARDEHGSVPKLLESIMGIFSRWGDA
jgi:hypothetical protein